MEFNFFKKHVAKSLCEFFRKMMAYLATIALILNQTALYAYAAPITPDGSTNTVVDQAPNGVPVVNIAAPSAGGVSKNNFSDFNVDKIGTIINNSKQVGISELGGALYANPHYTNREATIILNQVTSTNQSILLGFTEIFGGKAEYVLANPNGITCSGCGFINTDKLTLTTGVVNLDSLDNIVNIDVSDKGSFIVEGLGLNASNADYFDIVTRSAKINAKIWAGKELNVRTGRGRFNFENKKYDSSDTNGDDIAFAIDANTLGSMYAGKINLVATEKGVGVRNSATMVADTEDLIITADGDIEYKNIGANTDIKVTSNSGSVKGKDGVALANQNITIKSANKATIDNSLVEANNVNVTSSDFENSGVVIVDSNLTVNSNNINNLSNSVLSAGLLNLNATQTLNNDGLIEGLFYGDNILNIISAGNLNNSRTIQTADDAKYNVTNQLTNSGYIVSLANINLFADSLVNKNNNEANNGISTINGNININVNSLSNDSGRIASGNNLTVISSIISNTSSSLTAKNNLSLKADNISNSNGQIIAASDVSIITNRSDYSHQGSLKATRIFLTVGNFSNSGDIHSTTLTSIDALGDYTNTEASSNINSEGLLNFVISGIFVNDYELKSGSIAIDATSIDNNSSILATDSAGYIDLVTSSDLKNATNASIESEGNIYSNNNNILNDGNIIANNIIFLKASNNIINNKTIFAANSIFLDGININNNAGKILALNGDIVIGKDIDDFGVATARSNTLNNYGGRIEAGRDLRIDANEIDNASIVSKTTYSSGNAPAEYNKTDWNIKDYQLETVTAVAKMKAGRSIFIESSTFDNFAGVVSAFTDISINGSVTNEQNALVVNYDRTRSVYVGQHCNKGGCSPIYENRYETTSTSFDGLKAIMAAGENIHLNGTQVSNIGSKESVNIEDSSVDNGEISTIAFLDDILDSSLIKNGNSSSSGDIFNSNVGDAPNYIKGENTNIAAYTASQHFLSRIGYSSDSDVQLIGSPYLESKLINTAILQETGRVFLKEKYQSAADQIDDLYNNALTEMNDLNLSVGVALSKEQISQLKNDIVWLVENEVDGKKVFIPTIYLSQLTIDNVSADGSVGAVISGRNVLVEANQIKNNRSVIANDRLMLAANNDIDVSDNANFVADDSYLSGDNFNMKASSLFIKGNANFDIRKDFNLLSEAKTYKTAFSSKTTNYGSNLEVNGNLNLIAGSDINIEGSTLKSTGNTSLDAGNNFNLLSVADSSYESRIYSKKGAFSSKSSSNETWLVTQKGSLLESLGDLSIKSGNDINIAASDIKSDNLTLTANNDVNLISKENYSRTLSQSKKSSFFSQSASMSESINIRQVVAEADANANLISTSGGDTNLIAARLNSGGNTTITTGQYKDENGDLQFNKDAKLNILNAMDSDYSYTYNMKTKMDAGAVAVGFSAGGILGAYVGSQAKRGNINVKETYDETIVASSINAGNGLNIRSASDVNMVSSNLSSGTGDTTIIAGSLIDDNNNLVITDKDANINIASAVETHYSFEQNQKLRPDYAGIAIGSALAVASFAVSAPVGLLVSGGVAANADKFAQKNSTTESSKRQDFQVSSNVNSDSNILSNSQNNTNIIASNLNAGNDIILTANNDINLVSVEEIDLNSQTSSKSRLLASEKELFTTTKLTNKASNINSGNNLLLQSGGDTNIISSNVAVGTKDSNGNLIKGGDATIIAGKYNDETGAEIYDKDAKINIAAAQNVETNLYKVEKMSVKINDADKISKGFTSIYGVAGAIMSSYKIEYQDRKDTITNTTNQASNIDIANNLITNSASNTNILASNINVDNDAFMVAGTMNVNGVNQINDKANINIISAKDTITGKKKNDQLIMANDIEMGGDITSGTFEHKTEKSYTETNAASAINVGNNLNMDSTNDISIIGSDIMAGNDATLTAGRKVNILASQNNSNASTSNLFGKTGLELTLDANEISGGASARMDYQDDESEKSKQTSSNILANNIFINSKDDINLGASNLYAQNDVSLTSADGNVNIISANEMTKEDKLHLGIEAGVKIGITHNIGNNIGSLTGLADIDLANLTGVGQTQTTIDMVSALLSGDNIDEMLEGNEKVINDTSKLLNAGGSGGSAGIILHIEAEADKTTSKNTQALGSLIKSGNNINVASNNKDIKIEGSILLANNDVNLNAGNNIDIIASNNGNSFKNIGGSLSLNVALYGVGYSIGGELHGAKNSNNSYNNSVITANNNINIVTGNDTTIKGANLEAKNDLTMNIGGDLDVQSLQNTSKDRSFAIGGGYGTMNGGESYSANVGYSKGDRKWVDDQTTLIGGDSVDIIVADNTNLVGAIIANKKEDGIDAGNLNLVTNTLTYSDIKDKDKARSFSISGSYSNRETTQNGKTNESGSASIGLNYSMHDKQQDTNATIGLGNIVVGGTNSNIDETLVAGLNRDINRAQVITKNLTVDPIEISATLRWDGQKGGEKDYTGPIETKIAEWKAIAKNPLKPFEDSFKDITSDLSLIIADMRNSGQGGLANGIDSLTNKVGDGYWYGKDRTYDATAATLRAVSDNITGNGDNSSIAGLYNENKTISVSLSNFQNNREQTIDTYGLTNLAPEGVNENIQLLADNHSAYNPDAHNAEVLLYQDGSQNAPEAFAYSNKGLDTININTAKTDLTDSGEVVNKIYHEGYNFEAHSNNEAAADRYGDYAESRWNDLGERNNYQNTNIITSDQWNQQYTVANNKNLAIGTAKSYIQYNYNRKNTNNFFTPETAWDVANIALGSASLYKNLKEGNYGEAAVDAVGVMLDTGSAVIPALPGGYSTGIKASRSGDKVVDLIITQKDKILSNISNSKAARESSGFKNFSSNADNIGSGGNNLRNGGVGNNSPNDYQVGYHATTPESADLIMSGGFRNGTKPGRLGSDGVYVNSTPEGAIKEFQAHNGSSANPSIIKVEYNPGVNAEASIPPRNYVDSHPLNVDSISAPSIRKPGTTNTNILNNSAIPKEIMR